MSSFVLRSQECWSWSTRCVNGAYSYIAKALPLLPDLDPTQRQVRVTRQSPALIREARKGKSFRTQQQGSTVLSSIGTTCGFCRSQNRTSFQNLGSPTALVCLEIVR
jgi:hypothetical protein